VCRSAFAAAVARDLENAANTVDAVVDPLRDGTGEQPIRDTPPLEHSDAAGVRHAGTLPDLDIGAITSLKDNARHVCGMEEHCER